MSEGVGSRTLSHTVRETGPNNYSDIVSSRTKTQEITVVEIRGRTST